MIYLNSIQYIFQLIHHIPTYPSPTINVRQSWPHLNDVWHNKLFIVCNLQLFLSQTFKIYMTIFLPIMATVSVRWTAMPSFNTASKLAIVAISGFISSNLVTLRHTLVTISTLLSLLSFFSRLKQSFSSYENNL